WLLDPALTEATAAAQAQVWLPALTGVFRFPRRGWADFAGAFVNEHPVLTLVCDDGARRGDGEPVLVAHTTAEFAGRHLAQPTAAAGEIEAAVRDLLALSDPAIGTHVHRWTYARPRPASTGPSGGYHLDAAGIGLAGDAFGKPRVQTAWSSGRALGRALAERLSGGR
ncbi:NAD/FAD-dependent oxidoreductase, partial [Micromonospora zhanjiangensis]